MLSSLGKFKVFPRTEEMIAHSNPRLKEGSDKKIGQIEFKLTSLIESGFCWFENRRAQFKNQRFPATQWY